MTLSPYGLHESNAKIRINPKTSKHFGDIFFSSLYYVRVKTKAGFTQRQLYIQDRRPKLDEF